MIDISTFPDNFSTREIGTGGALLHPTQNVPFIRQGSPAQNITQVSLGAAGGDKTLFLTKDPLRVDEVG